MLSSAITLTWFHHGTVAAEASGRRLLRSRCQSQSERAYQMKLRFIIRNGLL